jgi:hypothetical protein
LSRIKVNLDALGICASTLCMIHCLAFPLVMAAIPLLRGGAEQPATSIRLSPTEADCCARQACCSSPFDSWVHLGLLATVAPLGMVAWIAGYRRHKALGVLSLGLVGLGLLGSALLLGPDLLSGRGEQVMTVTGSICMASAHLWNRRQCDCCRWPRIG